MMKNLLLLKNKSILFVEDDTITRDEITEILEMLFCNVFSAKNGEEAYALYEDESPDIILTDIKMPKKDGLKLIKQIRQNNYSIPIILLTSFDEQNLLMHAVNLSIDGYLIKPVKLELLTETLCKAIMRTHKKEGLVMLGKQLFYNSATKELYQNGLIVPLGVKEQQLLILLINSRAITVAKEEIIKKLWPLDPVCDSAIKNLILRLRKKLKTDIIVSVKGIGYRVETRTVERSLDS